MISRVLRGSAPRTPRSRGARPADSGGPVVENSRQSQTRLNASDRAELVAAYASGAPVSDLAARFRIHRSTVWQLAVQSGLVTRRPELSDELRTAAARLSDSGLTLIQVSERLGISDEGVRAAVLACDGTVRRPGRRRVHAGRS
ncbi:helix-turn-helix domain-containing protein [Dietzia alimentaria]|uniref:helix-turn-helix domain-containing protein n=1 Tax=Dietzia alimentaria TaxID=665550 RepID=UPI003B75BFA5